MSNCRYCLEIAAKTVIVSETLPLGVRFVVKYQNDTTQFQSSFIHINTTVNGKTFNISCFTIPSSGVIYSTAAVTIAIPFDFATLSPQNRDYVFQIDNIT